jgi:hypothetical protein
MIMIRIIRIIITHTHTQVEIWSKWDLDEATNTGLHIDVELPLPRMVQA